MLVWPHSVWFLPQLDAMDLVQYKKIAVTVVVKIASVQKANAIAAKMAYASKDANATNAAKMVAN